MRAIYPLRAPITHYSAVASTRLAPRGYTMGISLLEVLILILIVAIPVIAVLAVVRFVATRFFAVDARAATYV